MTRYLGRIESEITGSVEVYLIKTDNGVVAVIFWRSEHFDNIFVREFLKRVKAFRFDDSEDSSLTIEELENAEYFGDGVDGRIVKLVDGHYERSFPGMASQYTISLNDKVAFGDLDNDGDNDAAVILAESGGGSGTFMLLVIVENDGGKPRYVTHIELGDRIGINAIEINVENIVVNLLMHAKEDGLCCPSVPTIKLFSLLEGKLVESDQTKQTDFSFSFSQWETYRNDEYDFEFKYPKEFFTNTDTPNFIELSEDELFFQAQFALVIDMSVRSVGQGEFPYFEKLTMPTFFRLDTSILQKNIEGEIKTTFSGDPPRGYHYVFIPLPSNDNKGVQFSISTSNAEYPGYGGSFRGIETTSRILSTFRFIEQPEGEWSWNLLGCGSRAPCSYQISSIDSTDSYVCAGKYDALSGQGEVTPTSTTDPRTTTDFTCQLVE
ncbi:hypothetical protein IID24_04565 [Patescibacteria group bacterium]|nr:hypothetical protein [Patescibacteria group bacterium]